LFSAGIKSIGELNITAPTELFGMTAALAFEKSGDFLISPLFPRL
jgi:hypothetical protein